MATRQIYRVLNSAQPSAAAPVKQPTGAVVQTMLQIASLSTRAIGIAGWGVSLDGSSAATPGRWELFGCTGAATMSTAHVAADIQCLTDKNAPASGGLVDLGTTAKTAFATAAVTEGTVANYRSFDDQLIAPTSQYIFRWELGNEPMIDVSQFIRVRCTLAVTINAYIWVDIFGL